MASAERSRYGGFQDSATRLSLETVLDEMIDIPVDLCVRDQRFEQALIENLQA